MNRTGVSRELKRYYAFLLSIRLFRFCRRFEFHEGRSFDPKTRRFRFRFFGFQSSHFARYLVPGTPLSNLWDVFDSIYTSIVSYVSMFWCLGIWFGGLVACHPGNPVFFRHFDTSILRYFDISIFPTRQIDHRLPRRDLGLSERICS